MTDSRRMVHVVGGVVVVEDGGGTTRKAPGRRRSGKNDKLTISHPRRLFSVRVRHSHGPLVCISVTWSYQ